MQQAIQPISHPVDATVTVPGSKSITNRAFLLAALAKGKSTLTGVLFSEDTEAFATGLKALGIEVNLDTKACTAEITGLGGEFPNKQAAIYCRDAGTATRFLIPACAAIPGEYHFSASERMSERPIAPLLQVLAAQGSHFQFMNKPGHMPLIMESQGLRGGEVEIDISQSSQFLSGLLMAAPYAKMPMILKTGTLTHKPYVAMTRSMMHAFGVEAKQHGNSVVVPHGCYQARDYAIEPDASTASYFFAMAAITGGKIQVNNLTRQCMQGDIQFLHILEKMGCQVAESPAGITVQGPKQLKGLGTIDMAGFTDTFMTVAALAVFADGPTTIKSLAHTRLQESDRVAAIAEGLKRLGINTDTTEDSITIYPSKPHGATVSSYRDHRIAMSLSLIGLKIPAVIIDGAEAVAKTCPDYFKLLQQIC
jgi:3-phosphoshikimate 1-carboxyvinyltransferase